MVELINAIVGGIERLLNTINSKRRVILLSFLVCLVIVFLLAYQLIQSQDVISEFTTPRIERVSGWCYQQRLVRGNRIVAIQFPIPDELIPKGVTQSLAAFVFTKALTNSEFDRFCDALVNEILDPETKVRLLRANPEWKERLKEYYKNLDNPIAHIPLKMSLFRDKK